MSGSPSSVQQHLRGQLHSLLGELRVGDRLPSERELARRWGVARMTVRRSVDGLVAEGILERRHGSGTYVVPRPLVRALGLTSFHSDMAARGLVPGTQVLSFRTAPVTATMAGQLRMPVGDQVHHFSRLRLGSGEPIAVETTWLPAAVAPGLRESDLHGSLYELLARRYALVIGEAKVTIDPVMPDARTRTLLRIGEEQACLRIRMVDLDERGHVVMVAHCIYRGDQYQLTADVTGAAFGGDRDLTAGRPDASGERR
jgi:GntR family transcriptional regulator